MSLMTPATHYWIPGDYINLINDNNSAAIVESTATVGNYIVGLTKFSEESINKLSSETMKSREHLESVFKKDVFRVTEQITIQATNGEVIFLGTKFRSPYQWAILSKAMSNPDFYFNLVTTTFPPINIIENNGFELEDTAWEGVIIDTGVNVSGKNSGKVVKLSTEIFTSEFRQEIPDILTNTSYLFRFWVKTVDVSSSGHGAEILAVWKDAVGDDIRTDHIYNYGFGTKDWLKFTTHETSPHNAASMVLKFRINSATGTAWFDDIRVWPIERTEKVFFDPPEPEIVNAHYSIFDSTTAMINDWLERSSTTAEQSRIYRAEPYTVSDRYDFQFKKVKN